MLVLSCRGSCNPCAERDGDIYESDPALQCDLCGNWLCNQCLRASKSTYDFINKSKATDGIRWFCFHCHSSLPDTKKLQRIDDLENEQASYDKKFKELRKNMEDKYKQNDQVASSLSQNLPVAAEKMNVTCIVSQVLEEQHEREKRKLNVVCFGSTESRESSEERCDDNKERIVSGYT